MKKILKVFLIITIIITLTACGKKEKVSGDRFTDVLENHGFFVENVTNQMEDKSIKNLLVANDDYYQVEFFEFDNVTSAKKAFDSSKTEYESKNGKLKKDETYETYIDESSDQYTYISRVENTLLFASIKIEHKKEFEKIVTALNY